METIIIGRIRERISVRRRAWQRKSIIIIFSIRIRLTITFSISISILIGLSILMSLRSINIIIIIINIWIVFMEKRIGNRIGNRKRDIITIYPILTMGTAFTLTSLF